ncbi:hypothetical protein Q5P01_007916 [Channa striata]|uniref:Uncharacterized protein n=1 Tax=Channa striata TaxID=64152 RepID=A0AA88N4G5_CHASR|nr:hypothetical protein Q5P01_007916 [Channa striata]
MDGWAGLGFCGANIQKGALQATTQCESGALERQFMILENKRSAEEETDIAAPCVITPAVAVLPVRTRECGSVACGQVALEGNVSCESPSGNVGQKTRADPCGVLFNEHYPASRGAGRLPGQPGSGITSSSHRDPYCSWEQTAR